MLTILIILILFSIGIFLPQNSKISILGWFYLGWLSVNTPINYLGDYFAYKSVYNDVFNNQGTFEAGYTFLEKIANQVGLSFDQFRMIFVIVTIVLLYIGVCRFTKNQALFISIYLLTFYAYDLIQMRSQFMMAAVVLAYSFLINKKGNKTRFALASLIILLAAQIHSSGYIFLVGMLIYMCSKHIHNIVKFSLVVTLLSSFLLPLIFRSSIFVSIVNIVGRITGRNILVDKLLVLFTDGVSFSLKLWYFIPLVISWGVIKMILTYIDNSELTDDILIKYEVLICGSLISFAGFALLSVAPDYSRLFRHGMVFFIIMLSYYLENDNRVHYITQRKLLIVALIVPFVLFSFYVTVLTWGPSTQASIPYLLGIY